MCSGSWDLGCLKSARREGEWTHLKLAAGLYKCQPSSLSSRVTFKACLSVWDHTSGKTAKAWPILETMHGLGTNSGGVGRTGFYSLKLSTEQDAGKMEMPLLGT